MIKLNIKPLSVNSAWKGKRFKTPQYDKFIKEVLLLLPPSTQFQDKKNIKLRLEFGFSSRNSDCDNPVKIFIDCLVKKFEVDDRNIYEINIKKEIVKKGEEYIKYEFY